MHSNNFIDMTGWVMKEHGVPESRLTVIKLEETKNWKPMWRCICSCKDHNEIVACGANLRNGNTLSCGCLQKEKTIKSKLTHGDARKRKQNRLYKIWSDMKERCSNSNNNAYKDYGGRGIIVCNEWEQSYEVFKEWAINNGYKSNLTIDRINVNGNYEPENCRWVTNKIQQNNRRNNRYIKYNGETKTLSEWAEYMGVNVHTLCSRINQQGMPIDEALTVDVNFLKIKIEYNEEIHTINEWAEITGINPKLIYQRIYRNKWDIQDALFKKVRDNEKIIEFNGESHNIKEWSEISGIKAGTIAYRLRKNWPIEKIFKTK